MVLKDEPEKVRKDKRYSKTFDRKNHGNNKINTEQNGFSM